MSEHCYFGAASTTHPTPCALAPAQPYQLHDCAIRDAVERLCEDYDVTRTILGEYDFKELATAYVLSIPIEMWTSPEIGRTFPAWLDSRSAPDRNSCVVDVARCERLRFEAQQGEEGPIFDLGMLEAIDSEEWQRFRIRLHPATRFAWLSTPAVELWLAHANNSKCKITLDHQFKGVMFARLNQTVEEAVINATQHRLLCGIRLGETLGNALEAADRLYPESDAKFCLEELVRCRAFSPLATEPPGSNQVAEHSSQERS